MKTIYKQPKAPLTENNVVQQVRNLNTTGTLRRVEGSKYDLIVSYNTPIAYVVDVDNGSFINETKVILCNHYYSATTRKHQAKVRELYKWSINNINTNWKPDTAAFGEFDLGGFITRSKIDAVDIRGGANGGTNSNWLHA